MEKVYKTMQRTGAFSIVIGIVVLVTGLTVSFCFAKDRNCCFSQKGINDQNMNLKIIPLRRLKIDC